MCRSHKLGDVTHMLHDMNTNVQRRERGSLIDATKVGLWFEAEANERLTHMATAAGTTRSALAQWLIECVEADSEGIPLGWHSPHDHPEPLPGLEEGGRARKSA